jgi:hypothetical protein
MSKEKKQGNAPLNSIASDVSYLLGYLVNTKEGVSEADAQAIYGLLDKNNREELTEDEKKSLFSYRVKISSGLEGITPETLKATRGLQSLHYWYLIMLWALAFVFVGIAAYYYMLETQIKAIEFVPGDPFTPEQDADMKMLDMLDFFLPYVYGALGACVYLMRVTGEKFRERTFDPSRLPEHFNRLVLGGLSGGMIILFVSGDELTGTKGIEISVAALGFLAGYSIDFLYSVIDRLIKAIIPKVGLDSIKKDMNVKKIKLMVQRYKKKLSESNDDKEKAQLEKTISDLEESLL